MNAGIEGQAGFALW